MTKRFGNFDSKDNKKPKLDYDIDALWGEDLDEGALEDCIKLATQMCQEEKISSTQLNNATILPTYSAFKDRSVLISSTQFSSTRPSTSTYEPPRDQKRTSLNNDYQKDFKLLQQQYKEKEGEVTILRTQLQEARLNVQVEQQKIHNEWKHKLNLAEKEMNSIKTELEFKDLQIANLKQKVLYVTKHSKNVDAKLNATQCLQDKNNKKEQVPTVAPKRKLTKIQIISHPVCPLQGIIPDTVFNLPKREQYIVKTKLTRTYRHSIPYLQNQAMSSTIAVDRSETDVTSIYPDLLHLMSCTEEELNSPDNNNRINKVVCTCEQFLNDLNTFLSKIKDNLRTEDILEVDSNSLKQGSQYLQEDKDEIGVKAGILLHFIAELFPYSDYLKKYICQNIDLSLQNKDSYIKQYPYLTHRKQRFRQHYFLNTLSNIIRISGEIRKVGILSNFFCSTIKLLVNVAKSEQFDFVSDIFCKLTKEIILARPTVKVICDITLLLKVASQSAPFIEFLFNKSQNSITSKKGVLYFNESACRFYIFVMLFDNTVFKMKSEDFPKSVCLNLLCFMYNTFQTASWIHHRDAKECECVPQLYKLEIEIVFRALEKYVDETRKSKKRTKEWASFFKNGITVKVLSLMAFNSYELTEKYITVFSQYKEIEKKLQEENINELEKLNISEEIVEIPSSAFANIDF